MTSLDSIFGCAASDVTIERVRQLVTEALPESLTIEYKEKYSKGLVDSIAAMANSYGGVILVGVSDQRDLVGVPEEAVVQIVNACHESLEPPWQPEIIPVEIPETGGKRVLVLRVDISQAPRPVLLRGAAPVRLQGRNAVADRGRLARIFQEISSPVGRMRRVERLTGAPPGTQDAYDFALRSGIIVPVADAAAWRPLSDRGIDALAKALDASPIGPVLLRWCGRLGISGANPFHRLGLNRARRARLVWQAVGDPEVGHPIEAVATVTLPDEYGLPTSGLTFMLDVVTHVRAAHEALDHLPQPMPDHWLTVAELRELCDAVLGSLVDPAVSTLLAGLAGVDAVLVPQPSTLDFVTSTDVTQLLDLAGLTPIPDAGGSHGANLAADPSIDLHDPEGRTVQVDTWLQQIALDAGLRGMERLLEGFHR
jgi:hypothetical protein